MKIFPNTYLAAVVLTAFFSLNFSAPPVVPSPRPDDNPAEPWTMVYKQDGVIVYYEIMDCLDDHFWLFLKVTNNTGQQKKLRFTAQVANSDHSIESFNFIKVVAPYASEKSDCGKASFASGLVRPLKNGSKASLVTVSFDKESPLAAN